MLHSEDSVWSKWEALLEVAKAAQEQLIFEESMKSFNLFPDFPKKQKSLGVKRARDFGDLQPLFSEFSVVDEGVKRPESKKIKITINFKNLGSQILENPATKDRFSSQIPKCGDDEGVKRPALKRIKITHSAIQTLESPVRRDLQSEFKEKMLEFGGEDHVLVIEKRLFKTDVNKGHGRLSVTLNQLSCEFLTPEEKHHLSLKNTITVQMIEPNLSVTWMNLKKWNMGTSSQYILMTNWNSVRERNRLSEGDSVQLWAFRENGSRKLWFALVRR